MTGAENSGYTVRLVGWESPEAEEMKAIRFSVFVDEQNVPADLELDELDTEALHAVAKNGDGVACGTARMYADRDDVSRIRIGRMAVLKESRCSGCGSAILNALLEEARRRGCREVILSAQCHAIPFYGKFGFEVSGGIYDDAGIPHQKMVLKLKRVQ